MTSDSVSCHDMPPDRPAFDRLRRPPALCVIAWPRQPVAAPEACVTAGMVTETELEREGVLTRTLHSRALIVKPLGQRPAGVAKR